MDIDARAFGQMEGEVIALAKTLEAQNKTLEAQNSALADMKKQIEMISNTLNEARGGWRMLLLIGGASATAASVVTSVLGHIKFTP